MQKRVLVILLHVCFTIMTGCVSLPHEQLSGPIEAQELSAHVHFLADPALKGRKPGTLESGTARRYLKSRFEAYGLVPWAERKGYEQPFGFGTNVIGVLPGMDPNLANEIVILSAHYDHIGKTKKGVLLGACDNASGVAALLEIAEHLSMNPDRPKRSICFAAFDCEEKFTLGSFVFTCQEDFEERKIAAMVNIDLLGRDFLDVVGDSLFVVGTELYPGLRAEILQAGAQNQVKVLPIGTDLVGPRGDHVAFETMDIPVLFFSCGMYKDYHRPTDTADKLNYPQVSRSAKLIAATVNLLANAEQIEKPVTQSSADREELRTLSYVLEKISSRYKEAGLNAEQSAELGKLAEETQRLLGAEECPVSAQRRLRRQTVEAVVPAMVPANGTSGQCSEGLLWINEFYSAHRKVLIEGYRELVRHVLKNKSRMFGRGKFRYRAYNLGEDMLSFVEKGDGQYELDLILTHVEMSFDMGGWLLKPPAFGFGGDINIEAFSGSRDEVTSFCLLQWRKDIKDESYGRAWRDILKTVTGEENGAAYNDWLGRALAKQGFADEKEWMLNLRESENPRLAYMAGGKSRRAAVDGTPSELYQIIKDVKDVNAPARLRTGAIWGLDKKAESEGLLALVDVLTDRTPSTTKTGQPRFMDESYPFADYRIIKALRKSWEKEHKTKGTARTIGEDAEDKLKQLTGQNFGKDAKAWRKWIKANIK